MKTSIFVCIYRKPSSKADWHNHFNDCVDYLQTLNLPTVIAGDFNINLKSDHSFANVIKVTHSLKQHIREPTRITQKSATLIDHIYISRDLQGNNASTFNLHLSGHLAIYCQLGKFSATSRGPSGHNRATAYRNTKNTNQESLLNDLGLVPWHVVSNCNSIDDALHTFATLVTEVRDVHAPKKRQQKRLKPTPWMTPDLLGLIQVWDKLHKKFMQDKTSNNWLSCKQARNYATTAMRTTKRTFLTLAANNSKKFWSNISQCTSISSKRRIESPRPSSLPAISKVSGEAINNFSSAVFSITSLFIPPCESDVIRSECPADCTPASQATPFTLQHVTANDVTKAIKALTSSATTTRDQMSLKLLCLYPRFHFHCP